MSTKRDRNPKKAKPSHKGHKSDEDPRAKNRSIRRSASEKDIKHLNNDYILSIDKGFTFLYQGTFDSKGNLVKVKPIYTIDNFTHKSTPIDFSNWSFNFEDYRQSTSKREIYFGRKDVLSAINSLKFKHPSGDYVDWYKFINPTSNGKKSSSKNLEKSIQEEYGFSYDIIVLENKNLQTFIAGWSSCQGGASKGKGSDITIDDCLHVSKQKKNNKKNFVVWKGFGFTNGLNHKWDYFPDADSSHVSVYSTGIKPKQGLHIYSGLYEIINSDLPSHLIDAIEYMYLSDEEKISFTNHYVEKHTLDELQHFGPNAFDYFEQQKSSSSDKSSKAKTSKVEAKPDFSTAKKYANTISKSRAASKAKEKVPVPKVGPKTNDYTGSYSTGTDNTTDESAWSFDL